MKADKHRFTTLVSSSLIISLLALAGCNKTNAPADTPPNAAAAAAPLPYTPPTADQLSQMVAPIALFPDKLVAQVLAGATYPDQISAANQWLAQNPSLKGAALQNAANQQPWDVSVKSLTVFPSVLNQMASNIQWTTALSEAYVNDPSDVMNAIQAMRLRAQRSGNLQTSSHLRVTSVARAATPHYASAPGEPLVYSGPEVIPPPPQTIVIEPAQPDTVYVPSYNPSVVYGGAVPVYPGYVYHPPAYSTGDMVATGVLSFGVGILVGAAISNHDSWGWHSWGMNWGGPGSGGGSGPDHGPDYGNGPGGGWHRPAVTYNNATYISKSTTVINHIDSHNNNSRTVNNYYGTTNNNNGVITNSNSNTRQTFNAATPNPNARAQAAPSGPMTMPHFTASDTRPGARPASQPEVQHGAGNVSMLPRANGRSPEITPHVTAQKTNPGPAQHPAAMENRSQNAERAHQPDIRAPEPSGLAHQAQQARPEQAAKENMQAHQNPNVSAAPRPQAPPPHVQAPLAHAQQAEQPKPQAQPHVQAHLQQPHPQEHEQPHPQQPHPQEHARQHPPEHPHSATKEEHKEEKRG